MGFDIDPVAGEPPALAEINMVPLIDVMMVLLVIFLVTAPMLTQAVKVGLPQATSHSEVPTAHPINIAIDSAGALYWDARSIDRSTLQQRLKAAAQERPRPSVRLQADRSTAYEKVAQVMADASHDGIDRITFISLPEQP